MKQYSKEAQRERGSSRVILWSERMSKRHRLSTLQIFLGEEVCKRSDLRKNITKN